MLKSNPMIRSAHYIILLTCLILPFNARADMLTRSAERLQERLQERTGSSSLLTGVDARLQARLAQRTDTMDYQSDLRKSALETRLRRRQERQIRLELVNDLGDRNELRREIVRLVNIERIEAGLGSLSYNFSLETSAQLHAEDMLSKAYFSHYSLGGDNFVDRMQSQDYNILHAAACDCSTSVSYGENIAKGFRTPAEVMSGWMSSPPHKATILSVEYDEIGVGIAGVFWVQNFGAIRMEVNSE